MLPDPPTDETARYYPSDPNEGIARVLAAQDSGDWKPVADWLAYHPERAGEVAAFMSVHRNIVGVLPPPPARVEPADRTGLTVGKFKLQELIGKGGFAEVYRAYHPEISLHVAVKLLRVGRELSARELAKFRYEAEVAARLHHPNVVPVHDFGEAGGEPYLVMPLMEGGSLAERLKERGPDRVLAPDDAARLVRDVALGVDHAHQDGLIHRDLKPGNILLDKERRPHVADFGLALAVDVTTSGVAGTVAYMAPEQARGEKRLTMAVDVHALGVILFELLTGGVPFGGDNVASVMRRVAEEPAPPVRRFRPDVPRDLEAICAKCLEKRPQDRYTSAQELADDLTRFLRREPVLARPRGLFSTVGGALGWQRETAGMSSWRVAFWGGASTMVAMAVMQAAVLLDAPLWVSQAAMGYYFVGWLVTMWAFLVARRTTLNPVERASTAIMFGTKFGCLAILPVQLWLHDGNPVFAIPSFVALVGLSIFAHGFVYWGRLYLVGLLFFALAAALPLVPVTYWPGVYGVFNGMFQFCIGFHLCRVHRSAESASRSV